MSTDIPQNTCDTTADGNSDRVNAGTVENGLLVKANGSTVNADISEASEPVVVVVEEDGNRVVLEGSDKNIELYVESDSNSIVVDHNADVDRKGSGSGNSIRRKDLESEGLTPEEVVTETRSEALEETGLFGRVTIDYQKPKQSEDRCINCGSTGVSTIQNCSETVFVLLGYPIQLDKTEFVECEECHAAELSDEEWSEAVA